MQFKRIALLTVLVGAALTAIAQDRSNAVTFDQVIDNTVATEARFLNTLRDYTPVVETYIQNLQPDKSLGLVPKSDEYSSAG